MKQTGKLGALDGGVHFGGAHSQFPSELGVRGALGFRSDNLECHIDVLWFQRHNLILYSRIANRKFVIEAGRRLAISSGLLLFALCHRLPSLIHLWYM